MNRNHTIPRGRPSFTSAISDAVKQNVVRIEHRCGVTHGATDMQLMNHNAYIFLMSLSIVIPHNALVQDMCDELNTSVTGLMYEHVATCAHYDAYLHVLERRFLESEDPAKAYSKFATTCNELYARSVTHPRVFDIFSVYISGGTDCGENATYLFSNKHLGKVLQLNRGEENHLDVMSYLFYNIAVGKAEITFGRTFSSEENNSAQIYNRLNEENQFYWEMAENLTVLDKGAIHGHVLQTITSFIKDVQTCQNLK